MRTSHVTVWTICAFILIAAGCTSHYRVTDPASGKEYYTTKVSDAGRGGAVKIKDDRTGSTVTLQSSDVKEISGDEYDAGIAAQAAKTQPIQSQPAQVQPVPVQPAQSEPVQK